MNEKFFDLKKEKQDRMINAALKVFSENGYRRASTDEMVKEAGISKGLLFHYFLNKLGLYLFVYDYSVKFLSLELSTAVNKKETDYLKIFKQVELAKLQVIKNYPYMAIFLDQVVLEEDETLVKELGEKQKMVEIIYENIYRRADLKLFKQGVDADKVIKMLHFTTKGLVEESFQNEFPEPEQLYKNICEYLTMYRNWFYEL